MAENSNKRAKSAAEMALLFMGINKIDYDMMLKGNIAQRGRTAVRQTGVSVNGSTRIVTSGDEVDRATYEALLAADAIQVAPTKAQSDPPKDPPAPQPTAKT